MSKSKAIHDGSKIYDTPRCPNTGAMAGYNFCYDESEPSRSIGSFCRYTGFYERRIFRDLLTLFDIDMPDNWNRDCTLWNLFRYGHSDVVDTTEFGIIPQIGHLSGRNVYFDYTKLQISNPAIRRKNYTIGENCSIIKLNPDYDGAWDMVHNYAETLGMLWQSRMMAIANTRVTDVAVTDNNAVAQTFMQIGELMDDGRPRFVVNCSALKQSDKGDGKLPWYEIHNDVGKNYLVDRLDADIKAVRDEFRLEVGIPVPNSKKERMIRDEVDSERDQAMCASDVWFDTISESIKKTIEIFPELEGQLAIRKHKFEQKEVGKDDEV